MSRAPMCLPEGAPSAARVAAQQALDAAALTRSALLAARPQVWWGSGARAYDDALAACLGALDAVTHHLREADAAVVRADGEREEFRLARLAAG